jgi:hypothetical protein
MRDFLLERILVNRLCGDSRKFSSACDRGPVKAEGQSGGDSLAGGQVDTVKEIKPNQLVYVKEGEGNYSHRTVRSCQRKNIEIARLLVNPAGHYIAVIS